MSCGRRLHFHPNHRLQARNINKKKKGRLEDAIYYDEDQIRKMARCLVDALDYLHNKVNIVHRDIKPSNVLLDESGSPLLVDFGKAIALSTIKQEDLTNPNANEINDMTTSIEGTYTFLAPECCMSGGGGVGPDFDAFHQKPYSMKKADVWALGVTLYIITYNRFPYELSQFTDGHCTTELDIMESIANVNVTFPDDERQVSRDLKELLSMMLEKDPDRRPDIS
jgi:serine/threonine protein kinase